MELYRVQRTAQVYSEADRRLWLAFFPTDERNMAIAYAYEQAEVRPVQDDEHSAAVSVQLVRQEGTRYVPVQDVSASYACYRP